MNAHESIARVATWRTWVPLGATKVLCYIDNQAAMSILLSGWSKHPDLNFMVGVCWLCVASTSAMLSAGMSSSRLVSS